MGWQPPTEDEFNLDWFTPLDALGVKKIEMAPSHEVWALLERLRAGQIIAVARTATVRADLVGVRPMVKVNAGAWRRMNDDDEHFFWLTGDLSVETSPALNLKGTVNRDRFFDVRFDPTSFSGQPPVQIEVEDEIQGNSASQDSDIQIPKPQLAKSEAERFCRALIAGWPDASQDFAHGKAQLFFPDHKVPRDWFRGILRSIQGPKKPGKPGKTKD